MTYLRSKNSTPSQEGKRFFKNQLIFKKILPTLLVGWLLSACSDDIVKNEYVNQRVAVAILELKNDPQLKQLSKISGVNVQSFVCILEPFRNEVDTNYSLADSINKHLRSIKYKADEGYWALVQYSDIEIFQISIVKQLQLRLNELTPSGRHRDRGLCGLAEKIFISTKINNQINFHLEGEE